MELNIDTIERRILRRVIAQLGDDAKHLETIATHKGAASGGYAGFTYSDECRKFFKANRLLLVDYFVAYAEECGTDPWKDAVAAWRRMVSNGKGYSDREIGVRLFCGRKLNDDYTYIDDGFAWMLLDIAASFYYNLDEKDKVKYYKNEELD